MPHSLQSQYLNELIICTDFIQPFIQICMTTQPLPTPAGTPAFFSQGSVPNSVQTTHGTQANNEDVVINKAIFIWTAQDIKLQFWQLATVCTFLILWVPHTRPQGPFCRTAEYSQLFFKMLAAQPANWYSLKELVALGAKTPQDPVLHLLLLPCLAKGKSSSPF